MTKCDVQCLVPQFETPLIGFVPNRVKKRDTMARKEQLYGGIERWEMLVQGS